MSLLLWLSPGRRQKWFIGEASASTGFEYPPGIWRFLDISWTESRAPYIILIKSIVHREQNSFYCMLRAAGLWIGYDWSSRSVRSNTGSNTGKFFLMNVPPDFFALHLLLRSACWVVHDSIGICMLTVQRFVLRLRRVYRSVEWP